MVSVDTIAPRAGLRSALYSTVDLGRTPENSWDDPKFQQPTKVATRTLAIQPPHGRDLKPTRAEAEEAVRTLIRWAGDDPGREGLRDTPGRVVRAYEEWFSSYAEEPSALLQRTFEEVGGYDEYHVPMTRTHRPELARRGHMTHRFCSMGLGRSRSPSRYRIPLLLRAPHGSDQR